MKNLKKALIPVLLLALIFTLAACGSNPNAENIIGTWFTNFDYSDQIKNYIGADVAALDFKFDMPFLFDFEADGTYSLAVDKTQLQKNIDDLIDDELIVFVKGQIIEQIEGMMTYEAFEAYYEAENNVAFEENMRNYFDAALDVDTLTEGTGSVGRYKVVGDKLFLNTDVNDNNFGADYCVIEIVPDEKLTLVSSTNDNFSSGLFEFPLELTKVK